MQSYEFKIGAFLLENVALQLAVNLCHRKLKEREQKRNEFRVIRRLENIAKQKEALEERVNEEKEKLIRKQKEVTGDYQIDSQSNSDANPRIDAQHQ